MAERLEPRAEARLRPADPLRNGSDSAAIERVEVQHPIGLTKAERAQDDRLGLVRSPGHRATKCRDAACRESRV